MRPVERGGRYLDPAAAAAAIEAVKNQGRSPQPGQNQGR
jgi:2,3-bisphosphoglycerate-dependent phosphoglycerate mutase